jgi:GTP cyclohydrolase I
MSVDLHALEKNYAQLLKQLGEDPQRSGLLDTPLRAAKAMEFLTSGYREDVNTIINDALFESENTGIVIVKDIELYSLCEHHLLPFYGRCHIGYIPNGKVLGVSKFARIIDHFSRRLQIQENLTEQVATCIMQTLKTESVAVIVEAKHLCMMMRGVEKQNSTMTTSVLRGSFYDEDNTRAEFFSLINK